MSGRVRAAATGGRLSWREAEFCVVDLELTGLDPRTDEIVSFGAVPVDEARVAVGRAVYGLVRPARPLPEASVVIHGIRPVDLDGAPLLAEAIRPLVDAMTGRVLVAHSASIERAFLGAAMRRRRGHLRGPFVDTEILGRLLMAERGASVPPFLPLRELAAYLGLPQHRPHHALGDALTTAQAFIALASHLEATGIATVKSLTQAVERLRWLKR